MLFLCVREMQQTISRYGRYIQEISREELFFELLRLDKMQLVQRFHDGLAQNMIGLSALSESDRLADRDLAKSIISRITDECRQIMIDASQIGNGEVDLKELCEELIQWIRLTVPDINVDWHFQSDLEISNSCSYHTFRIIEQAVLNTINHAGATNLIIDLEHLQNGTQIRIADNGCGFDANQPLSHFQLGFKTMMASAKIVGYEIDFYSDADGTTIRLFSETPVGKCELQRGK